MREWPTYLGVRSLQPIGGMGAEEVGASGLREGIASFTLAQSINTNNGCWAGNPSMGWQVYNGLGTYLRL